MTDSDSLPGEQADDVFVDDEDFVEPSPDDAIEPSDQDPSAAPVLAALPDGSGHLVLTGPGAGSAVRPSTGQQVAGAVLATRDQALDGTLPIVLVHRGRYCTTHMPHVLGHLHAATSGGVRLGAVVDVPSRTPAAAQQALDDCRAAAIRIADPRGYLCDGTVVAVREPGERLLRNAPYLAGGRPAIADVLDAQRRAGANLLLTSGRALDPGDAPGSLARMSSEGDAALALLQPGERLALNVTLPAVWLASDALRTALLDELLDKEQFDVWYVRVQVSERGRRSTEQPLDEPLLRGYKRLSELAFDEERLLLLPQTGLTGWLQLGFGAAGFGTGGSGADQTFGAPASGGGGSLPLERYFERDLLHAVEHDVHDRLAAAPSYVPCPCPYCPSLLAGRAWSYEMAAMHQIYRTGLLTAAVAAPAAPRGTAAAVRRTVRAAVRTASNLGLTGPSRPGHLPVWDRIL